MIFWIFFSNFVCHSWSVPMMTITGLSHLFKWENLRNWWLTKLFFFPTVYTFPFEWRTEIGCPSSAVDCIIWHTKVKCILCCNCNCSLLWYFGLSNCRITAVTLQNYCNLFSQLERPNLSINATSLEIVFPSQYLNHPRACIFCRLFEDSKCGRLMHNKPLELNAITLRVNALSSLS